MYDTKPFLLNVSLLLARFSAGALLCIAGGGKVFGWFGYGLDEAIEGYAKSGFSAPLAYLSIFTEFIGGFLLVIGLFTRPAAFALVINMLVATIVTLPSGIFGSGAHVPFIYLIMTVVILLAGPMAYSIDRLIFRKKI